MPHEVVSSDFVHRRERPGPGRQAKKAVLVLAFALALCCVKQPAAARTITVGATESNTASIAAGLQLCRAGDRLLIKSGHYQEDQLLIDKPIDITGEKNTILDGSGKHQIMLIKSDHVQVRGLKFVNTGISYVEDRAGLRLEKVRDCTVEDNSFTGNLFAIYLSGCKQCRIANNRIMGSAASEAASGNGIHMWHSSQIEIADNEVTGQRDGIYLEFVDKSNIKDNKSIGNIRYGLHFMYSNNDTYSNNVFAENGAGVAVMYSRDVTMTGNLFKDNWGQASYGLLLKEIEGTKISRNSFLKNTIAMQCDGTKEMSVTENDFKENGKAVRISSYSSGCLFERNNFVGNAFDLSTCSALNETRFDKNYYADNQCYDLNHDGIADQPYQPMKLSCMILDQYPAASVLLRSPLFDLLDLAEQALPAVSPETLKDNNPLTKMIKWQTR